MTGDYQSFCLNLSDTSCIDEVIEALIQKRIEKYEQEIDTLKEINEELITDNRSLSERVDELEKEVINQRTDMYEK